MSGHGDDALNNAGLFLIIEAIIAIALLVLTGYTGTQGRARLVSTPQSGPVAHGS